MLVIDDKNEPSDTVTRKSFRFRHFISSKKQKSLCIRYFFFVRLRPAWENRNTADHVIDIISYFSEYFKLFCENHRKAGVMPEKRTP
jgi:hypothetical protein